MVGIITLEMGTSFQAPLLTLPFLSLFFSFSFFLFFFNSLDPATALLVHLHLW